MSKYLFIGGPRDGEWLHVPDQNPMPPSWKVDSAPKLNQVYTTHLEDPSPPEAMNYTYYTLVKFMGSSAELVVYVYAGEAKYALDMLLSGYRRLDIFEYDAWLQEVRVCNEYMVSSTGKILNTGNKKEELLALFKQGVSPLKAYLRVTVGINA